MSNRFELPSARFWLRLGRSLLFLYAAIILGIAVVGMGMFPEYASTHAADFRPSNSWTPVQVKTGLDQLGWPATVPAYAELVSNVIMLVVGSGLGLLVLWRRTPSLFTFYLAFVLISFGAGDALSMPLIEVFPALSIFRKFMGATGWQFFFILFFFFPNGKAVPAWTRWLALAWLGVILLTLFVDLAFLTSRAWFYILLVLTATGSQVYRYFWRSSGVERQQSRWVIATVILMMIYIALVASWAFQPPSGEDLRLSLVLTFVNLLFITILVALFPMAVAMAIFRYRLWDIDLVIRRTLVYAVLTALLGLGYYGLITVLQGLFVSASGQQSPLALVISTLVIAALSSPLRRRVQQLIDRRFFRQRYDSTQAVERFSHNLRQLADLPGVEKELMRVVQETLQPERVSLWITDPQTIQQEQKA